MRSVVRSSISGRVLRMPRGVARLFCDGMWTGRTCQKAQVESQSP